MHKRTSLVVILVMATSACRGAGEQPISPLREYDMRHDESALEMAKDDLGTKYDLPSRLFIAQYYLSRYIKSGDKTDYENLKKYYQGIESIPDLSRSNKIYEELILLGKYLDAAILLYGDKKPDAAKTLLDSYCTASDIAEKMRCHAKNVEYFDGNAQAIHGRDDMEKAYLQTAVIGGAYHHAGATGHALWLQAHYDLPEAEKRASAFKSRNEWNDQVMTTYCSALDYYRQMPGVTDYNNYVAAFRHAKCQIYVGLSESGMPGGGGGAEPIR